MSGKKFERFGKYLILDHLVNGGMAKICRARHLGEQANKLVVVKMVQPQYSNDEAFVRMFQDELNITFGMIHPNIMQVYDYGKVNGQLYTAMEYIHGANLKQYLDRLKERKVVFPVEISCYIISQVCLGLHYAHTFTDKLSGKPFNIVHRDISPHNIMLTYDGAVKVIDFGIAKAETNSEKTQAGTIKGKLSYLAPEYIDGIDLDARYDQFALGITFWEMLCSRKLFEAKNDLAVLKLIQNCKIVPPSEINPSVPKELDEIIMKSLSKDRSRRYEDLDQMNRALIRFVYSTYPEFNPSDLKKFAYDLFKNEIEKDSARFVEYGSLNIESYIREMQHEQSKTGKISRKETDLHNRLTSSREIPTNKPRVLELDIDPVKVDLEVSSPQEITGTRKLSKTTLQNVKTHSHKGKSNKKSIATRSSELTGSRSVNKRELHKESKKESSSNLFKVIFLMAGSLAALAYFKGETIERLTGFNLYKIIHSTSSMDRQVHTKPDEVKPNRNPSTIKQFDKGEIILGGVDVSSMDVLIDGTKIQFVGKPIRVPLNKDVIVTIKKTGHVSFVTKVRLDQQKMSSVITVPELERSRIGLLTTSRNYGPGFKLVYEQAGEIIERDLPFENAKIPEGHYQAKIINTALGTEKNVEFFIEENKKHFLD